MRIFKREFSLFVLPIITLTCTTLIVGTALLLTKGGEEYIVSKNRELLGGDIQIESKSPIDVAKALSLLEGNGLNTSSPGIQQTAGISFSTLVGHDQNVATVQMSVIDEAYPLYGNVSLVEGKFVYPKNDEIYIDKALAKKFTIGTGALVTINRAEYKVVGVIATTPDTLFAGVSFFPKAIMSKEAFLRTKLEMGLLRSEYTLAIASDALFSKDEISAIQKQAKEFRYDIDFRDESGGGFLRGLESVKKFIIIAVLISCILASVNIYAGVLYLVKRLRKSLAIMTALGATKPVLGGIVSLTLLYTLVVSLSFGWALSILVYKLLQQYIVATYAIVLPTPSLYNAFFLTALLVISTSLVSSIPTIQNLLTLSPKKLLYEVSNLGGGSKKGLLLLTCISFLPLLAITIYLLGDAMLGVYTVIGIALLYVVLASLFYLFILVVYSKRARLYFLLRSIISIKHKDGLFGVVSITSLYIALTSIATLILLQTTLFSFLQNDISNKLPSLYLIDIQKSQKEEVQKIEPNIVLFPNVGARLVSIDNRIIRGGTLGDDENVSRELTREFNLSYTGALSASENIIEGKDFTGIKNEVSVDNSFAERAGIALGSVLSFDIQGITIVSTVTSIRETKRNSGLPFFYFLFREEDLRLYPATYFGYGYFGEEEKTRLSSLLAETYPNISIIDTQEAGDIVRSITQTLSLLVLVITVPPLVLSVFLVTTLLILSFASRQKLIAQLLALGAKRSFVTVLFYVESISFTVLAAIFAYITAIGATTGIATSYLDIDTYILYSHELMVTICAIIVLLLVITSLLSALDRRNIKKLLSYEEN